MLSVGRSFDLHHRIGGSHTLAAEAAAWRAEAAGRLAKHRRTVMSCEYGMERGRRRRRYANNSRRGRHRAKSIAQSRRALLEQRSFAETTTACACFTHSTARDRRATQAAAHHATATLLVDVLRACRPLGASPLYSGHAGPQNGWPAESPIVRWDRYLRLSCVFCSVNMCRR